MKRGDLGSGLSETKGILVSSPFLTYGSTFQPLSFSLRRTLQATMLRLARLDGSAEEEGTRGGARMKGLYFHINDFTTASFHPRGGRRGRGRGRKAAASVVAAAATIPGSP